MKKERRYLILGLLVLISFGCVAQDYDDDDGPPQEGDAEYPGHRAQAQLTEPVSRVQDMGRGREVMVRTFSG